MKSKLIKKINDRIKIYQIYQSYLAFDEYDSEFFHIISANRSFQKDSVNINLNDIQVQADEKHTNKIELSDEMGIIMKYPSIDSFSKTGITDITASNMLDVIITCMLQIYDKGGEEVFEAKDSTKKELIEFIEQLNTKQFQDIQNFFDTKPK